MHVECRVYGLHPAEDKFNSNLCLLLINRVMRASTTGRRQGLTMERPDVAIREVEGGDD